MLVNKSAVSKLLSPINSTTCRPLETARVRRRTLKPYSLAGDFTGESVGNIFDHSGPANTRKSGSVQESMDDRCSVGFPSANLPICFCPGLKQLVQVHL